MELRGLLLIDNVTSDGYDLHLVSEAYSLWGQELQGLIISKAPALVGKINKLAGGLIDIASEDVPAVRVEAGIEAFPEFIESGTPFYPYDVFQSTEDDYINTPCDAHLRYISGQPYYELIIASDMYTVNACLCKVLHGVYRKNPKDTPIPVIQGDKVSFPVASGTISFPLSEYTPSAYSLVVAYVANPYNGTPSSRARLDCFDIWGNDVPDTETWHYIWNGNWEVQTGTENGMTVPALYSSGEGMTAGFSPDIPADIFPARRYSYFYLEQLEIRADGTQGIPEIVTVPGALLYVPDSQKEKQGGSMSIANIGAIVLLRMIRRGK